jgi:hypothetical protein
MSRNWIPAFARTTSTCASPGFHFPISAGESVTFWQLCAVKENLPGTSALRREEPKKATGSDALRWLSAATTN